MVGPRRTALTLTLLAATSHVHASPQDLFGYGPRAAAMAGTGTSFSDDLSAVYANPAGLSRARDRALTVGYAATGFALTRNDAAEVYEPGRAALFGLVLPLPFRGVLRDRLAVGLGFFTPTNVIVRGVILHPETPRFVLLPDRVQSVAVQAALGVDVGWGLRVGAGFMALAALTGSVLVTNDATGRSTSRIDDQLVASYTPVLGAQWERGDWRVGAVFRGRLIARFGVVISAPELGIPVPPLNIAGVAQYDPAQVQVEGAWRRGATTVVLGVTLKQWSAYPGPSVATTATSPAPVDPGFADTVVPRAAIEHRVDFGRGDAATLRAGYFFEPSPAPSAGVGRQYLDNDRHAFTLGLGLGTAYRGSRFSVDAFGQLHVLATREGSAHDGSPMRWGGTAWHLGVTTTVGF